jgi:hypothetical protein
VNVGVALDSALMSSGRPSCWLPRGKTGIWACCWSTILLRASRKEGVDRVRYLSVPGECSEIEGVGVWIRGDGGGGWIEGISPNGAEIDQARSIDVKASHR